MGCATITTEHGTAFICGLPVRVRKKCKFCKARDVKALCDWPVMRFQLAPASSIQVGEIIRHPKLGIFPRTAEIQGIDEGSSGQLWFHCIVAAREGQRRSKPAPFHWHHTGMLYVMRPGGTCDNACCFRHRRHVGPNRDYCMDHWGLVE